MKFREFLSKYSNIDDDFLDDFFSFFEENNDGSPTVNIKLLADWLGISRIDNLFATLKESYVEGIDYVIESVRTGKPGKPPMNIFINPRTLKKICMRSNSPNAEKVRDYFLEIEDLLDKFKTEIISINKNRMENMDRRIRKLEANQRSLTIPKKGVLYILKTNDEEMREFYKVGKTRNLKNRLFTYNSDKIDNVYPIFIYQTDDIDAVEKCTKAFLEDARYRKKKEIYMANLNEIKNIINACSRVGRVKVINPDFSEMIGKDDIYVLYDKNENIDKIGIDDVTSTSYSLDMETLSSIDYVTNTMENS